MVLKDNLPSWEALQEPWLKTFELIFDLEAETSPTGDRRAQDPRALKTAGDDPPEIWIFQQLFASNMYFFIFQPFQN